MTRLAKKCVIASGLMHGTLVMMLLVGPAFMPSEAPKEAKQIGDVILIQIPEGTSGDGNGDVTPTNPTPPPPETATPVRGSGSKSAANTRDNISKEDKKIVPNLNPSTRGSVEQDKSSMSRPRKDAGLESILQTAHNNIINGVSPPVQVNEIGSQGGGGIPDAGFNGALIRAYMRAWLIPSDVADETSTVVVTVTLRRDGSVISSSIQSRSGNPALDDSVQRALRKVTYISPLPESGKDAQRTFRLEFNPKAKRMMG
jgi:TonB family protein